MKTALKVSVPLFLVLAGAFFWQRHALAQLQREQTTLAALAQESIELGKENQALAALNANAVTNSVPDFSRAELLRLRNEVRQLRTRVPDLLAQRVALEQLKASPQGSPAVQPLSAMDGYVPRPTWASAGQLSPAAAVSTLLSSLADGDLERFVSSWEPKQAARFRQQIAKDPEGMKETMQRDFAGIAKLAGYRVAAQETQSDGSVLVGVQASTAGEVLNLRLRLHDGQWKVEDAGSLTGARR